jgi:hypothetical protein
MVKHKYTYRKEDGIIYIFTFPYKCRKMRFYVLIRKKIKFCENIKIRFEKIPVAGLYNYHNSEIGEMEIPRSTPAGRVYYKDIKGIFGIGEQVIMRLVKPRKHDFIKKKIYPITFF